MTILVTGRGGMLATDLVSEFEGRGVTVVATSRQELDLSVPGDIAAVIASIRPSIIVNTAADTDVDGCESREAAASTVNGSAVGALATVAGEIGAHFVTLSTDYVFDGRKDGPYTENDRPNPTSAYGRSKLRGEELAGERSTIVRTAWLAGAHGPNVVRTALRLLEGPGPVRFVDDQRGSPTFTRDLAVVIADLALERLPGLFHVTNAGAVTWFEFVQEIARQTGADPGRVEPIATAALEPPRPALRPANSVLDNMAWRAAGGTALRPYEAALSELLTELG